MGLSQKDGSTEPVELPWPEFEIAAAGQRPLVLPADLRGVAHSLRAMGVDTEILDCPGSNIVAQARAAAAAGRRIACRGRNYHQIATLVPQGYCYHVKATNTSDQVAEILRAFNVIVSTEDIFSRCQACNCNEFLKISREMAKFLLQKSFDGKCTPSDAVCSDLNLDESTDQMEGCQGMSTHRSWKLIEEPPQLKSSGLTSRGMTIQIQQVPAELLDQQEHLYVCDMCGKCFWDGSHLKRFVNSARCAVVLRRGEAML